jgi:hypothetical protein
MELLLCSPFRSKVNGEMEEQNGVMLNEKRCTNQHSTHPFSSSFYSPCTPIFLFSLSFSLPLFPHMRHYVPLTPTLPSLIFTARLGGNIFIIHRLAVPLFPLYFQPFSLCDIFYFPTLFARSLLARFSFVSFCITDIIF